MSKIAIIGAGRVAATLAAKLADTRHEVVVGVRSPLEKRTAWPLPAIELLEIPSAIRAAEIVINATPGATSLELYTPLAAALAGKILIDVSNATRRRDDGLPGDLLFTDGSLAEHLQRALPSTSVVKTLNTMLFTVMTHPAQLRTPPNVFLSGDDANARAVVRRLLWDLGWNDEWIEDLGGIASARGTEALILLAPYFLKARGLMPFAVSVAR